MTEFAQDDLTKLRKVYTCAFYLEDVVMPFDSTHAALLDELSNEMHRATSLQYVVPSADWLERFEVLRTALRGLGEEIKHMPRYYTLPVTRLKLGDDTIMDREHYKRAL